MPKTTILERMATLIAGYIIVMWSMRALLRIAIFLVLGWAAWDVYTGNYENSTPVMLVITLFILVVIVGWVKGR